MRTDRQTDRRTDGTKLVVAFRNITNSPAVYCKRDMQELMYKIVRINCRIVHLLLLYDLFCSSKCKE